MANLEVEQKFRASNIDFTLLKKWVSKFQGTFKGETEFVDTYYDTQDLDLTLQDIWLRQREQEWQLKLPVAGAVNRKTSAPSAALYNEVEGTGAVLAALQKLRGQCHARVEFGSNIAQIYGMEPICSLRSRRKKFKLLHKDREFHIDLDEATFLTRSSNSNSHEHDGIIDVQDLKYHAVGELEVMCTDLEDVAVCRRHIAGVWCSQDLLLSNSAFCC